MSDEKKNQNQNTNQNQPKQGEVHENYRRKSGWINEGQQDYDKIRKGAEVVLRPTKPNTESNSNNKSEK